MNAKCGLTIKEQAQALCAICRYTSDYGACPAKLIQELNNECPFDEECKDILPKHWSARLEMLEREAVEEGR